MSYEVTAKIVLCVTGLCYLVCAGFLIAIASWVFSTYNHFDEIADSSLTLFPASIILAVGAFMCIIGILSVVAAFKRNKCVLAVFFCLVLLVFIGEVSAGALGYCYRGKVEGVVREDLMDAINNYNETVNKEQIDYLQKEFHCCGVHNASDWLESTSWHVHHPKIVPQSCCRETNCTAVIDDKIIYTEGCLDTLEDKFKHNLVYIAVSVVIMAVLQILALMCTCVLVCRTRDQVPYMAFGEPVGGGLRV